jgi:hypothetical protein
MSFFAVLSEGIDFLTMTTAYFLPSAVYIFPILYSDFETRNRVLRFDSDSIPNTLSREEKNRNRAN